MNRHEYDKRCQVLAAAMRSQRDAVALNKPTSNLFHSRNQTMYRAQVSSQPMGQ
ncbi:MAG: hypothetical protein KA604_03760 [Candidatus Saccharimonas sp.]|nr:hypothetical protein [Candidatus Saccharimonas sp.]